MINQPNEQREMLTTTHYDSLGIPRTATIYEIRTAYHHIFQINHPDNTRARRPFAQGQADKVIQKAHAAWQVLSDPTAHRHMTSRCQRKIRSRHGLPALVSLSRVAHQAQNPNNRGDQARQKREQQDSQMIPMIRIPSLIKRPRRLSTAP